MSFLEIPVTWTKDKRWFINRDWIKKVEETKDGHAKIIYKDGTEDLVPQAQAGFVLYKLNAEL